MKKTDNFLLTTFKDLVSKFNNKSKEEDYINDKFFNDELFIDIVEKAKVIKKYQIGYPINENFKLYDFYKWYNESGIANALLNNVGDPNVEGATNFGTFDIERKIIKTFAKFYGFDEDDVWGFISTGGTDSNNHGIYYGRNYLKSITKKEPILYVSTESHYSNMRLAELQQIETRMIPTDEIGRMIPAEFKKALDNTRPALVVFSMGTTFKGGIDDQKVLNIIIEKMNPPAVYRHVDAALFGGYLAFSDYSSLVDKSIYGYNSISISGHKFFGNDESCGLFFTTKEILKHQNPYNIAYLNGSVPTISCSRSAISSLKIYYLIKKYGIAGFKRQANRILENTAYLKSKLDEIGWSSWISCKESNTVFFKKPKESIMKKYYLAHEFDERFGGDLAHIVVMQSVSKTIIDKFIDDISKEA